MRHIITADGTQKTDSDNFQIKSHAFFNALVKADSIIRASGKRLDVMKFIYRYRQLNGSYQSANPRGPADATRARHAKNRAARKQYLTDNADRPISEIAATLGITEKTAACLFSKMGVKRKWKN